MAGENIEEGDRERDVPQNERSEKTRKRHSRKEKEEARRRKSGGLTNETAEKKQDNHTRKKGLTGVQKREKEMKEASCDECER